jgi:glycosyltransferase involved in cell wall biosynthesis
MPRVLRIINRLNLGGPTYNAAYLSKYLAPEFETLLVAGTKLDTEESSEFIVRQMGLEPVMIPEMRREIDFFSDRKAYHKITELIRKFRPHIVHTHAAKAGTLGRLAAFNMDVPVILHTFHGHVFHSYFNPVKTAIFKRIERYLSAKSTRIIAISELQKDELCRIHRVCRPEQTVVIPLGFDLSRFNTDQERKRSVFRAEYGIEPGTVAMAIIGRIVPVKNHEFFIRALHLLKQSAKSDFIAFVVGDGELREQTEKLATSLGLTIGYRPPWPNRPDVVFTSWIHEIDFPLAGCDVVALTSRNEGTPVSLIEAQAAGKAVVTLEAGGIGNVVLPGKSALVSPQGDLGAFTANLLKLTDHSELRHQMSASGSAFVNEKFHFNRLVGDMRTLYRSLLKEKGI